MDELETRVVHAAEAVLGEQRALRPTDVLVELRWLTPSALARWQQGREDDLESVVQVGAAKLARALEILHRWAGERGLPASEAVYTARTRDRRPLRFSRAGDDAAERAYRTHWTSPDLSDAQRRRLTEAQNRPPDLVVVAPLGDWVCSLCEGGGDLLIMEGSGPVCLACADLDHLVFLPAGDAALSRRAKRASGLSAVVVRFSRTRRRYERQGVLVEEDALAAAEAACLADEEARQRRRGREEERRALQDVALEGAFADEIARQFPGCPPERAAAIARHACTRGSGRVGRSAAGRGSDPDAVRAAVVAAVRHGDTAYDELLMRGVDRAEARQRVAGAVHEVLEGWRSTPER